MKNQYDGMIRCMNCKGLNHPKIDCGTTVEQWLKKEKRMCQYCKCKLVNTSFKK